MTFIGIALLNGARRLDLFGEPVPRQRTESELDNADLRVAVADEYATARSPGILITYSASYTCFHPSGTRS